MFLIWSLWFKSSQLGPCVFKPLSILSLESTPLEIAYVANGNCWHGHLKIIKNNLSKQRNYPFLFFSFSFIFSFLSHLFLFLPRFFFPCFFLPWFQYMGITKPPASAMRILHSSDSVKVDKLFNGSDPDLWRRGPVGLHHQRICVDRIRICVDPWAWWWRRAMKWAQADWAPPGTDGADRPDPSPWLALSSWSRTCSRRSGGSSRSIRSTTAMTAPPPLSIKRWGACACCCLWGLEDEIRLEFRGFERFWGNEKVLMEFGKTILI